MSCWVETTRLSHMSAWCSRSTTRQGNLLMALLSSSLSFLPRLLNNDVESVSVHSFNTPSHLPSSACDPLSRAHLSWMSAAHQNLLVLLLFPYQSQPDTHVLLICRHKHISHVFLISYVAWLWVQDGIEGNLSPGNWGDAWLCMHGGDATKGGARVEIHNNNNNNNTVNMKTNEKNNILRMPYNSFIDH